MNQLNCAKCSAAFAFEEADARLLDKLSPIINARKIPLPPPRLCPSCRLQRRMAWRNERHIYTNKCAKTGARLISAYHPAKQFPVIHCTEWWKDENDALLFGRNYDPGRSLFEQLKSLIDVVPRMHVYNYAWDRQVNSDYTNCAGDMKDCYLIFGAVRDERCMYSNYINDCYDCIDNLFALKCSECSGCIDIEGCQNLFFSRSSKSCYDSWFLFDCRGCHDCICCAGLRQKEYHIFNQPYSKDDYFKERERLLDGSRRSLEKLELHLNELLEPLPRRFMLGDKNENSFGDFLSNSKNCWWCFDTSNAEDCRYCTWFIDGRDCMDFFAWGEAELCYEVSSGGDTAYRDLFCALSYGSRDCMFCDTCMYCKNCFACVGLKQQQYCILNKQYSEQAYFCLVEKIIHSLQASGEWGEGLPAWLSPFGYNESVAVDFYPLAREAALQGGFAWSDYTPPEVDAERVIHGNDLPETIAQTGDEILGCAIRCEASGKLYKITRAELAFYRQHSLPLPNRHPEQRHLDRLAFRNPRHLWRRFCEKCGEEIYSTYSPSRTELVYCDRCYQEALY